MEPSEIIVTIAQLAIGLAGFSGVVVSLNPTPISEWTAADRLNFRILLQVAAVTTFFAILPFPIHVLFESGLAWQVSLLIYGVFHIFDVASFALRLPEEALPVNRIMLATGAVIAVLQILTGIMGNERLMEFMYLAALIWHLSVSFFGFTVLVYGFRRERILQAGD